MKLGQRDEFLTLNQKNTYLLFNQKKTKETPEFILTKSLYTFSLFTPLEKEEEKTMLGLTHLQVF